MRVPSLPTRGAVRSRNAWAPRTGSWLMRWTPSRRRLAGKPICRSAARFVSRLDSPKSRVSLIVVSVRSALPSLWFLSPRPEPGYDVTDGHAYPSVTRSLQCVADVAGVHRHYGRATNGRPAGPGDVVIVQKVLESSGAVSWTVLGDDLLPVEPVEAYLAHLSALERSPNTLRAYAQGLKLWMEFLQGQRVDWAGAGVELVSRVVARTGDGESASGRGVRLLRLPCPSRGGAGRRPGGLASGRAWLPQAVPAPRDGGQADRDASDQAGGAAADSGDVDRRPGACAARGVHPAAGPLPAGLVGRNRHADRAGAGSAPR